MSGRPSLTAIKAATAARYGVTTLDLESKRRSARVTRPRHIAMFLSRELTPNSLSAIGARYGDRDHTTVANACSKMQGLVENDVEFQEAIDGLMKTLRNPATLARLDPPVDLSDAAQAAMMHAIKVAKLGVGGPLTGPADTMRRILFQTFGEEPVFTGPMTGGGSIEILTSQEGNWSIVQIQGDRAALIESGTDWSAL